MRMIKKIVGFSLVSLLILSLLLSGCAKKEASTDNGKPAGSEGTPSSTGSDVAKPENQPVTLTWYQPISPPPDLQMVEDELNKQLKEKLPNTTLKLEFIDPGSYVDKMNMMMSAQQEMDIVWTSNWSNPYVPNVMKGAYKAIDDLVDKYMPKTKAAMPQYVWDSVKVNGKIYGVPNYQIIATPWGIRVVKELMDKYGLDVDNVKKLEDLEPFFEKLKANEPGIYPISVGTSKGGNNFRQVIPELAKYETIAGAPEFVACVDRTNNDLKVVNEYKLPEYKEFLAFVRDWYEKGYIRQDIASVTDESADVRNHKYAVFVPVVKPGGAVEMSSKDGIEYVEKILTEPWVPQAGGQPTINAISSTSKNPERAAMLLELVNTDKEFFNTLCFGIENVHYKKIQDNPVIVEPVPDSKYNPGVDWRFGNVFNAYYRKGQQPGTWEETDKLNREAKVSPMLGFTLNPDPIKNEIAAVTSVVNEYRILEKGAIDDWEAKLAEFQAKLDTAGAERIVQEVQRQLDEWKKTK
ncbi:ABC transporter substrate-binding protein [Mahella australiensis]|uniref:Extracellular solute-binding protein family 1 n=1 Tax=Mahella australiensis (strain DSM 15567 / CIP 107919 / 50-1 BON) TaxID=697281 RepID=F3ZYP3_MAHA5|nr:ABC transporter substrate-binding protein [Mahella australiensis]AEE97811.1 extracellular solute-binding protein family 1 [Mahella australiensis 50-1 BON]